MPLSMPDFAEVGELRHRLTLQEATETTSAHGAVQQSWNDIATLWGAIDPLAGREGFAAQQMYASATHHIRLRYRAGIVPKMRFAFGSRTFEIDAVLNTEERNRELVCIATERV